MNVTITATLANLAKVEARISKSLFPVNIIRQPNIGIASIGDKECNTSFISCEKILRKKKR